MAKINKRWMVVLLVFLSFIPIVSAPIWYGSGDDTELKGKWSCEGNFLDSSGQGKHGTQSGGVTITDGYKGRGCGFDNIDNEIAISSLVLSNESGTVSVWFKLSSTPTSNMYIFSRSSGHSPSIYVDSSSQPILILGASSPYNSLTSTAIPINSWTHAVGIWNSTNMTLYINGALTVTGGRDRPVSTAGNAKIGNYNSAGGVLFNGTIDEVRIYNRSLTATEISSLYNTSKTYKFIMKSTPTKGGMNDTPAPTASDETGLVGYWKMDDLTNGNTTDSSGQKNNGSVIGATYISAGRWNSGYSFDGSSNYININDTLSNVITNQLTVSVWYYRTGDTYSQSVIGKYTAGSNGLIMATYTTPSPSRLYFYLSNATTIPSTCFYDPTTNLSNRWVNTVLTYNGTNMEIYENGAKVKTCTGAETISGNIAFPSSKLRIGDRGDGAGASWFKGSIDEVRIYNRSLNLSEIQELYLSKGLVGYWKMDADQKNSTSTFDTSGYYNHGIVSGAALTGEGRFKEGYKFDGNNDYIAVGTSSTLNPSTAMTLGAWVYINSGNTNYGTILARWNNVQNSYWIGTYPGSSKVDIYFSGSLIYTTPVLPTNQWIHFAVTHNGSNVSAYKNGEYLGSGLSGSITASSINTSIGYDYNRLNYAFNGTIDEVRIYNRALSASEVAGLYNGTKSNKIVFKSMPSITSLSNETPVPTSSNETGLVGWYQMENNANDISGQGNNGIVVGAVANVTGRWNNALNFTGNGKYINYSAPTSLDIEQAGTISAWIKPLSRTAGGYAVLVRASGGNWEDERLFFGLRYATNWMQCALANGTSYVAPIDSVSHNLSKWYHVACTWNGTLISIYNEGVLTTSSAYTFTPEMTGYSMYTSSSFGAWTSLEGAVDEIRIYNRSLSAAEIQELYLSKGLVGKWTFNADERNTTDTYDSSGYYNHGKITGAVLTNEGRFKEGYKLDGNDRIWTPLAYDLDTENYTFSAWVNAADLAHNQYTIFGGAEGGVAGNYWALIHRTDKSGVTLQYANGTGMPALFITPSQNLVANKTSHIAMVRGQGSNVKLYQDGVQISDQNMTYVGFENCNITIGQDGAGGSSFVGMLDEIRIYNKALTATEIGQLYNGTKSTKLVWKSVPG